MDLFDTVPRRRQTVHGDEIRMVVRPSEFKQPLPPGKKIPARTNSDSSVSPGPLTGFRRSLTMRRRKAGCKVAADSQMAGSGSLSKAVIRRDIPASLTALHGTMKTELRRRVSSKVLRHKLTKLQDYSLPDQYLESNSNSFDLLRKMGQKENVAVPNGSCAEEAMDTSLEEVWVRRTTPPRRAAMKALSIIADMHSPVRSPQTSTKKGQKLARRAAGLKDPDLQQKIDHEIKMREGTTKLLAASKHPSQRVEAARSLLCSNTRIIAYMTELQRRKTQEVLGHSQFTEGNQLPCRAQVCISDIRIPLMWKDTDHFKNKGDYRQYAVFCLLKVGTEIFDTSMVTNVDRSMTDITFEDVILFQDIAHDFELKLEVYCHKQHEELCVANTPKKIRKKITDISGSVGRSVGKRLSGLNDADVVGSMVLGPRFELVAKGTLQLQDVHDSVRTFDFELERNSEGKVHELPLFGNYCCRVAAVPDCLTKPVVTGYLNVQEGARDSEWQHYWCILKNLQLACWSAPADVDTGPPLLSIPLTKSTQVSEADPSTGQQAHTFLIKTVSLQGVLEHRLAADTKEEVAKWWDGFQQHLLDQALWKQACDAVMTIKAPSKSKVPFTRQSSLYDETPLIDPDPASDGGVGPDTRMGEDQLSQLLSTLMAESGQAGSST